MSFFGKKRNIYEPEEVDQLAPLISRGLDKISNENVLYHQFDGERGRVSGEVFYSDEQIHWRFKTVAGIDFSNQRMLKSGRRVGQGNFWKLVPGKGQGYFQLKKSGSIIKNPPFIQPSSVCVFSLKLVT